MTLTSCGQATCSGGLQLDHKLDSFPLLVHVDGEIRTEDGNVRLNDYVYLRCEGAKTTPAHVRQLHAYAILAGLIDI